jgi:hypothetical protein
MSANASHVPRARGSAVPWPLFLALLASAVPVPAAAQIRELGPYLQTAAARLEAADPGLRRRTLVVAPSRRTDEARFPCGPWVDAALEQVLELAGYRVVVDEARAYWLRRLGEAAADEAVYRRIPAPAWDMPDVVIRPRVEVREGGFVVLLRRWDPAARQGVTTAAAWTDFVPERVLRSHGGLRCVAGRSVRGQRHPWLTLQAEGGLARLDLAGPGRTVSTPAHQVGAGLWLLSIGDRLHLGGRASALLLPDRFVREAGPGAWSGTAQGTITLFLGRGSVQPFLEGGGGYFYLEFPAGGDARVQALAPTAGGSGGLIVYVSQRWALSGRVAAQWIAPFDAGSTPPGAFGPHRFDTNRQVGAAVSVLFMP